MSDFPISTLDLVIIGGYFAVVFIIGYVIAKRTESGEDLFLAGRSLAWGTIGFSLFAPNISSTTLIGLAGDAHRIGIAVSNYEWMAGLVLVFLLFYFIPSFIKSRLSTIPEFLEKRFDVRLRKYFSGLMLFTSIVIDTAGGLYAGTIVLRTFFPELDFVATAFALALVPASGVSPRATERAPRLHDPLRSRHGQTPAMPWPIATGPPFGTCARDAVRHVRSLYRLIPAID